MSSERNPYSHITRPSNRFNQIDIKEVMKREIYKQGYDPDTNFRLINPPSIASGVAAESEMALSSAAQTSGFEDTYLYFDSTQRGGERNDSGGGVRW